MGYSQRYRHLTWALLLAISLFASTLSAKTFIRVENLYDPSIGCYRNSGCVVYVYADSRGYIYREFGGRKYYSSNTHNRVYHRDPYYNVAPIILGLGIATSLIHHHRHDKYRHNYKSKRHYRHSRKAVRKHIRRNHAKGHHRSFKGRHRGRR